MNAKNRVVGLEKTTLSANRGGEAGGKKKKKKV